MSANFFSTPKNSISLVTPTPKIKVIGNISSPSLSILPIDFGNLTQEQQSGALVYFVNTVGLPLPFVSVKTTIKAVQSGSGNPAPNNIRPISGWTGANIYVSPTQDVADATVYSVTWTEQGTIYGGTIDFTTGELIVTHKCVDMGDYNWTYDRSYLRFQHTFDDIKNLTARTLVMESSMFVCISDGRPVAQVPDKSFYSGSNVVNVKYSAMNGNTNAFKTAVTGQKIVYPLEIPNRIQLTPTQVKTLEGQNNVWSDCGEVDVTYYARA